uniref:Uncharacterized protein n=1 Tax=Amphora coffeiformis TaxID=265554 RepID=A0A7S3KVN3_9STRA|mmetsp:Transcript_15015/g.28455  ORF Transcript_15015/g.28455 Transcript_15015/m.28455 type:complete len:190 (-) Transcript_15015:73-642(-)
MLGKGKKKNTDEKVAQQPQSNETEESSTPTKEGFLGKVKRRTGNASKASSLAAYKTKKQTQNSMLKSKQTTRKEKFGVDYIDLVLSRQATQQQLQDCKNEARADVQELQEQIDHNLDKINTREEEVHEKIILANGEHSTPPAKTVAADNEPKPKAKPFWKQGNNRKEPPGKNPNKQYYPEPEGLVGRRK